MVSNSELDDIRDGFVMYIRDMLEGFAIAIILAFIFRGFVIEAFIIPTGSMAHGLQGTHIEHDCHICSYRYRAGASEENDGKDEVVATVCPMCGFTEVLDKQNELSKNAFSGDRILVNKFSYMFKDPDRWDVIVFKNPLTPTENYIKRLIGLPNETLLISNGDIYTKPLRNTHAVFEIARKPERKHLSMMQLVHDTQYRPQILDELMWPQPWRMVGTYADGYHPPQEEGTPGNWIPTIEGFNYSIDGTNTDRVSIRYHHNIPDQNFWVECNQLQAYLALADESGRVADAANIRKHMKTRFWPRPKLITDTYAYNTTITRSMVESNHGGIFDLPMDNHVMEGAESDLTGHSGLPSQDGTDNVQRFRELMQGGKLAPEYTTRGLSKKLRVDWPDEKNRGQYWVGDLTVEFDVVIESDRGKLGFDIVESGVHYEGEIDVATGKLMLSIDNGAEYFISADTEERTGYEGPVVEGQTPIQGKGAHTIRYSNFDNELRVWVDGTRIELNYPATFVTERILGPKWSDEDPGDLLPVGLHSTGLAVTLEDARVYRDVYYIASTLSWQVGREYNTDLASFSDVTKQFIQSNQASIGRIDPIWLEAGYQSATEQSVIQLHLDVFPAWNQSTFFTDRDDLSFNVMEDEFFPMGDNSPASADARWNKWTIDMGKNTFNRKLFIGEALMIYWPHPHGDPFLDWPIIPNFSRIGVIQ